MPAVIGPSQCLGWILAVLVATTCAGHGGAQATRDDLRDHARIARRAEGDPADRVEHARALVEALRLVDWPIAFDLLCEVAARRDAWEYDLEEARRPAVDQWDPDEKLSFGFFVDRRSACMNRAREARRLESALRAEEAVLDVFRAKLAGAPEPAQSESSAEFAAGRILGRKRADLAAALRALGFFPTPGVRRVVLKHLDHPDPAVSLAATRACGELARSLAEAATEDPFWAGAFERIEAARQGAWRDCDRKHRVYRTCGEKSATAKGKMFVGKTRYMQQLGDLLQTALNALSDPDSAKKKIRGAGSKCKAPDALKAPLEKALARQEAARREFATARSRARVLEATTISMFGRLSEQQRAPIESRIVERLQKPTAKPESLRLIRLCGGLRSDAIRQSLVAATSAKSAAVRVEATGALARQGRPETAPALGGRLVDSHWSVRIAAARALSAVGDKQAVDMLVSATGLSRGREREEIGRALRALTGAPIRSNEAARWRSWWDANRERYVGPPQDRAEQVRREHRGSYSCFGIRTHSRRVAFLVDRSVAMSLGMANALVWVSESGGQSGPATTRMDHARQAIGAALDEIPMEASFNILTYGEKVTAWKRKLVLSRGRNRDAACKWLAKVTPDGGAAVFDALLRAFDPSGRDSVAALGPAAADTIFLLAGGPANGGSLASESDIIEEIVRLNRLRQVTIHTVAVGGNAPGEFLRELAARCGGKFTRLTDLSDR